jgi:hypothetical protein
MKITTVLAVFAASSLFATGAFAQTMQPIPNPPETEHPAHHAKMHHHAHHHHLHVTKTSAQMGGEQMGGEHKGGEQKGGAAPNAPKSDEHPK